MQCASQLALRLDYCFLNTGNPIEDVANQGRLNVMDIYPVDVHDSSLNLIVRALFMKNPIGSIHPK